MKLQPARLSRRQDRVDPWADPWDLVGGYSRRKVHDGCVHWCPPL